MRCGLLLAATFAGALITCRSSYFLLLRPLDRAFTREAVNLFVKEIIGKAWEGKRGRQQIDRQETAAGFAHDSCELLSQLGGATYFPPLRSGRLDFKNQTSSTASKYVSSAIEG